MLDLCFSLYGTANVQGNLLQQFELQEVDILCESKVAECWQIYMAQL